MLAVPAYPTYTIFLAFGMAVVVAILLMPPFIRFMKRDGIGQQVRADGPQTHLVKQGTPTMGGIMFIVAIGAACVVAGWE